MSMRSEFEVAFMADVVERHGQASADHDGWLDRNSNGEYRSFRANGAWWGFQEARKVLVDQFEAKKLKINDDDEDWALSECWNNGISQCQCIVDPSIIQQAKP